MNPQPSFRLLTQEELDRLWAVVQQQFVFDSTGWTPLWLNGIRLGLLDERWRDLLMQDWTGRLKNNEQGLFLETDGWLEMADSLQSIVQNWHRLGLFGGWRNEKFDVEDHDGNILFSLERSAFRPLGLCSKAVHVNGLTEENGEWKFWIGRRSRFKAVDPDKLDNLVGGGVADGESILAAMHREAWEEAGLSENILPTTENCSRRMSVRKVSRGLHMEKLYIFDIVLSERNKPDNQDGEVSEFFLMGLDEVVEAMTSRLFMNDAMLATLDLLERLGVLGYCHNLSKWLKSTSV
ncbi:NUDIX hydrolase [Neisseria weaveri]|uniref:NUDIX hydrolase n=1 Tax=Neisseria weaveri TaxID=28091 RepID=UPI0007C9B63A|nr:NUDIX domain-containing protein [Neisseria weaveri]SAY51666.1 Thiamin pyrophosphokinase-related protein [Neisseria weaveri]